ncbi:AraC family transcriptional regulator [Sellimonas intestinalis]|uniref:AraC family transcriptional regulator n=1 Tax=Sellimonas intestinalis TaxID=1653434 RepID=UPI0015EC59F8|nr:AraC family transcriptional regulator [Sellimonas intestinalis]MBA2213938.1 helix-turn-helix transcriptional regulator [Sellimonas intestinalis]
MKTYQSITLKNEFSISQIYSIHYFEYMKDYVYDGESHDFWEILCVDSGSIEVTAGTEVKTLHKDEMIFHKPKEFHALRADGVTAPNLFVISFDCQDPCIRFFAKKTVTLNQNERFYLGQIISEARKAFFTPLNNPNICTLERLSNAEFASEHVIRLSLELLLISLYRRYHDSTPPPSPEQTFLHPAIRKNSDEFLHQTIDYMKRHIYTPLTLAQICKENSVSRSQLQKLFHDKLHCGVIEYFCHLKIRMAQQLIREHRYNYTEIANILGYSSYQYFSLQFKKYTRMTPSQYFSSIKSFADSENPDSSSPGAESRES